MSASDSVVAMHPTASRTRQVVAPAPAELDLDRLEAGQTFPPLPPLPHEDHTHSAWSTPLPPSPTVSSPTLGLASHADSFPDLNLSTPLSSFAGRWTAGTAVSSGNIKVVTAAQYAALQYEANNLVLPERILFPWSHGGADVVDSPAANYFGFERGQSARTPNYRGLTVISADNPADYASTLRKPDPASSCSTSNSLSSEASSNILSSPETLKDAVAHHSVLVSSFNYTQLLSIPAPSTPTRTSFLTTSLGSRTPQPSTFSVPPPRSFHRGVNLRHFALQPAKFATICDVVVYGHAGINEQVKMVARRASEAQQETRKQRQRDGNWNGVEYVVYVISDPFSVFEAEYPELVAIDAYGHARNKLSFLDREREEMRVLTQASEIGDNVWLGNTQDLPHPPKETSEAFDEPLSSFSTSTSLSSLAESEANPYGFAICVEAFEGAKATDISMLRSVDAQLDRMEQHGALQEVHLAYDDDEALMGEPKSILRPRVDDIIHLECPALAPTPATYRYPTRARHEMINTLVTLATYIHSITAVTPDRPSLRVLLHCHDGYTETSLLALTYIMYTRQCCLPEAYVWLHLDGDRSFFVGRDEGVLLEGVERRVRDVLQQEREERVALAKAEVGKPASSEMSRSDSGYASNSSSSGVLSQWITGSALSNETIVEESGDKSTMTRSDMGLPTIAEPEADIIATPVAAAASTEHATPVMTVSTPTTHAWYYADTWEASFPSRILPFLYLGNLAHANNALMLKELGITHVVSMGESALLPPSATYARPAYASARSSSTKISQRHGSTPTNSLWLEERLGNISVLDLPNVLDDGIDSLAPFISPALDFIARARAQGGKILVHCKVGVSRSASIVIAFLMQELSLDLASAYLLTRSRRLNILIQPNLPFMASLHGLEIQLIQHRERQAALPSVAGLDEDAGNAEEEDDSVLGQAGLKRSNRVAWSYLAGEIARLNERFLC